MEAEETSYNDMQTVKRRFFAMRNGVVADVLRKGGSPFHIIFGLNLPQIADIASEIGINSDLAERLWANTTTRESMLLAPMIVDKERYTIEDARRWTVGVKSMEIADVMCLKLLKHTQFALQFAEELKASDNPLIRYTAIRLMVNIMNKDVAAAMRFADSVLESESDKRCLSLAKQLKEECEFMMM